MSALFPVPKIQGPKVLKIDVFDVPQCRLTPPLQGTSANMHKIYTARNCSVIRFDYIFAADSMGLPSFKFSL